MLERMKVVFQTGRSLGKDLDLEKLERQWDGLLLATGGGPALRLGVPGENLPGVCQGLDLLRQVREEQTPRIGRSVLIIGGGNTAVDAALTCRKLGAQEVNIICLEERGEMPAFPAEIEEALEEGVRIQDGLGPAAYRPERERKLTVDLSRCLTVFDEQGRFCPSLEETCSPFSLRGNHRRSDRPETRKGQPAGGNSRPRLIRADRRPVDSSDPAPQNLCRRGICFPAPGPVIEAMAQGREAAVSIDRFLSGETLHWGRAYWDGTCITEFPIDRSGAVARRRAVLPRLPVRGRDIRTEVEKTLDLKAARKRRSAVSTAGGRESSTRPVGTACPVKSNARFRHWKSESRILVR